ncbi:sarcosine oxidase subunit gamma, partial [bacterium M00.F.Ca.ET.179.01.1.1]
MLPPAERLWLRGTQAWLAARSKALGVTLPVKPKSSATKDGRTALWLGPDEWMIIDEAGNDPLADCAKISALHSAVGISHRNVGISVAGPA